jgi:prepilin-type N-terminal cleavage/methylation domain-containing protein
MLIDCYCWYMKIKTSSKRSISKGFTLVELSIVLVIIGLIVGGVVGGQALVRSAKVSATVFDIQRNEGAFRQFYLQYDAMPGDFSEATDYWPGVNATNGNGNNILGGWWNTPDGVEYQRVFLHMSLAELVDPGLIVYDGGLNLVPDTEIPAISTHDKIYMNVFGHTAPRSGQRTILSASEIFFQIGAEHDGPPDFTWGTGFDARTTRKIDKKMDDGAASTGKIIATSGDQVSEVNPNSTCTSGGEYVLTENTGCVIYSRIDY